MCHMKYEQGKGSLGLLGSSLVLSCWATANFYHDDEDTLASFPWHFKSRI